MTYENRKFFWANQFVFEGEIVERKETKTSSIFLIEKKAFNKATTVPFALQKKDPLYKKMNRYLKDGKFVTFVGSLDFFRMKDRDDNYVQLVPQFITMLEEAPFVAKNHFIFSGITDGYTEYKSGFRLNIIGEDNKKLNFFLFNNDVLVAHHKKLLTSLGSFAVLTGVLGGKELDSGSIVPNFNNISVVACDNKGYDTDEEIVSDASAEAPIVDPDDIPF